MKRKAPWVQVSRRVMQSIGFLLFPGLFIEAFNGIKTMVTGIMNGNAGLSAMFPRISTTLALVVATAVLGRFFCGFICAFGTLGDLFHAIGRRLSKRGIRPSGRTDRLLRSVKYGVLLFVACSWVLGVQLTKWSPWDAFGMLDSFPPDFRYLPSGFLYGTVILAAVMFGSMFIERFFCRYLCPLGAVFGMVSGLRLIRFGKPAKDCGKCRICTGSCAMGIPLYEMDTVDSGDCIGCAQCIAPCPKGNVRLTVASRDAKPLVATAAAASVMGLYYVGNIEAGAFGGGAAHSGTVARAAVADTAGVARAGSVKRSDAYAGADARINDSRNAEGWVVTQPDVRSEGSTTDVPIPVKRGESKGKAVGQAGMDEPTVDKVPVDGGRESGPKPVAKVDGQPVVGRAKASAYADGTYTGSGIGFRHGTTTVSVTVSGGRITDIQPVSTGDDNQFFNSAFPSVTSGIINGQTASVDAVSGATFSSNGIMEAVADALAKARG